MALKHRIVIIEKAMSAISVILDAFSNRLNNVEKNQSAQSEVQQDQGTVQEQQQEDIDDLKNP